jgi:hypothetical protein
VRFTEKVGRSKEIAGVIKQLSKKLAFESMSIKKSNSKQFLGRDDYTEAGKTTADTKDSETLKSKSMRSGDDFTAFHFSERDRLSSIASFHQPSTRMQDTKTVKGCKHSFLREPTPLKSEINTSDIRKALVEQEPEIEKKVIHLKPVSPFKLAE